MLTKSEGSASTRIPLYSATPKQMFVVVGEAVSQAVALQKVACKALGVPVLVTETVAKQVRC